jgi:hypothetical protein
MALPQNSDIALTLANYNQHTGRFNLPLNAAGNDVVFDDTQAYAVQTAAGCIKGGYIFDPLLGSDLNKLKHLTSRTPQQATSMILEAMDPLVRANKIQTPQVSPPQKVLSFVNALSIDMFWNTPGGAQQSGSVQL